MSEIGNFLDGRKFLTGSPFRSGYFITVSLIGLASIGFMVFIIQQHRRVLTTNYVIVLCSMIGGQTIYQWLRSLRYFRRIRELFSQAEISHGGTSDSIELALRVAAGAIVDILFYTSGMTLFSLFLIMWLLERLEQLK